jgi:hypothetical protein
MCAKYDSFVRFKFHTELKGEGFKDFIYDTIKSFLFSVDFNTEHEFLEHLAMNEHTWNEEGYISGFYVGSKFFGGCKMYFYDEFDSNWQYSIIFRDHYSESKTKEIILISNAFEIFLNDNHIKFTKYNRNR